MKVVQWKVSYVQGNNSVRVGNEKNESWSSALAKKGRHCQNGAMSIPEREADHKVRAYSRSHPHRKPASAFSSLRLLGSFSSDDHSIGPCWKTKDWASASEPGTEYYTSDACTSLVKFNSAIPLKVCIRSLLMRIKNGNPRGAIEDCTSVINLIGSTYVSPR